MNDPIFWLGVAILLYIGIVVLRQWANIKRYEKIARDVRRWADEQQAEARGRFRE